MRVNTEEKLKTLLKTAKAEVTARADEVKAIGKTLKEFRVEKEKQVDKNDRNKGISYTSSPLRYHV